MANTNFMSVIKDVITRLRNMSDNEAIKASMKSNGDITKIDGYDNMVACLNRLKSLDNGGKLGRPYRVALNTHSALIKHRKIFTGAFKAGGSETMRLVYATTAAGLVHLVSLICAECVKMVKQSNGEYTMEVDKVGVDKISKSIFVTRLESFNERVNQASFTAITESAVQIEDESLHESLIGIASVAMATVAGTTALVYIARDLLAKFYELRGTFSRWLMIQANFVEMNALALGTTKPTARARQEEYAERMRALADRIRVDEDDTERNTINAIATDDRRLAAIESRSTNFAQVL